MDARLVLVHHLTVAVPAMADTSTRLHLEENAKADALNKLRNLAGNIVSSQRNVRYHVTKNNLVVALNELSGPEFYDVVMLGLKGAGFFKKFFIGSTATKIMEDTNNLTVAVPENLTGLLPEKIVVALHYKFPLNENSFSTLLSQFNAEVKHLEFISVVTPADNEAENSRYVSKISAQYGELIPTTFKIFQSDDVLAEIKTFVHTQGQHSFLVVQKGPRTLTDRLFRDYFINDLLDDGSMPLIILPL